MRITNNMITNNYLNALNSSLEKQAKAQEQLTDGKAIHRPSDDPIKTIRSLRFNTSLAMNEQYTQNLSDSQSWMDNTDGAMNSLDSIMIRVKELVISADGTKPADALNAIGLEIDQLINQAVTIGNSKIGDRYLFAGQTDKTQPFERKTITDPNNPDGPGMDVVVYNGDSNKVSMQIKPGLINPAQDSINVTGSELFGPIKTIYGQPTTEIFNQLIAIKQELQGGTHQAPAIPGVAGAVNVKGTYTGTGVTYFDVKIDSTTGGSGGGTVTNDLVTTAPLNTQFFSLPATFNLQINGSIVPVNTATDTMTTLLNNIQAAGAPGGLISAQCDPATGKVILSGASNFTGSDAAGLTFLNTQLKLPTMNVTTTTSSGSIIRTNNLSPLDQQFSGIPASFNLTVNGTAIVPAIDTTTETISGLLSKIQTAGAPGITNAQYDSVTGKITLTGASDFTGSDPASITFLNNQLKLPTVNPITATSSGNILDPSMALGQQFSGLPATFNLKINGTTVPVNTATDTMTTLLSNIQAAGAPGGLTTAYDPVTGKITLTGTGDFTGSDAVGLIFLNNDLKLPTANNTTTTSSGNIIPSHDPAAPLADQFSLPAGNFNLTLTNGGVTKTLTFDPAVATLNSVIADINAAGVNANASYDFVNGKFTLAVTSGTLEFTGSDSKALGLMTNNLHVPSPAVVQVETASYSTDGGNTWQTASVTRGTNPVDTSTLTLSNGMSLDIADNAGNKTDGTYSFRMPVGEETDWLSRVALANVDAAHSAQLRQHTQLGARMATYEMAKNMMENNNTIITGNVSANEDIDFSKVIIDQQTSENVYKAALAVGAKIMPVSLVDFLR